MKVITILTIFLHNIVYILSSLCNNTQYWCHKSGYGLKHLDPRFSSFNHTDYKNCVQFCQENIQCKAFEYDAIEKTCRFSSEWCRLNVNQMDSNTTDIFWKRSTQMSCSHELNEGNFTIFTVCSICKTYSW